MMFLFKQKLGLWLGGIISIVGCAVLAMQSPIPQPLEYHNFADANPLFGIPNFWNVMSNLPFLIVGLLGIYKLSISKTLKVNMSLYWAYFLFFFGVSCVALGSGYYCRCTRGQIFSTTGNGLPVRSGSGRINCLYTI